MMTESKGLLAGDCRQCLKPIDELSGHERQDRQDILSRLVQEEGGWGTLAQLYANPKRTNIAHDGKQTSGEFQLDGPKLRTYGAAKQLIEESRAIFINNLTNLVNSFAIAQQFYDKVDEDHDGTVTRAQLRQWVRSMVTADAYAGLDHEALVAEVCSRALGSTPDFEMHVSQLLDRATRKRGIGQAIDGDVLLLGAPPESWVRKGHNSDADPADTASDVSGLSSNSADSTGTLTPTSSSSGDDGTGIFTFGGAVGNLADTAKADPDAAVAFEDFKKAVDALSLKTLLRTDAVRNEVPVSEDPPKVRLPTLVAQRGSCPTLWDEDVSFNNLQKNRVRRAWEDAYASGKNCIWVVPEPDQDVRRVLAEGWFETRGVCLELGCGLGYDSVAFAQAGFDVVGVDISATAIREARAMARSKGVQDRVLFLCGDAYDMPKPTKPVALIWDNTLYQNAHRGDRYGPKWKYNSARYKELLLKLTVPGSLVMMNVMSSELTEGHTKLAQRGFNLPLTSAMRLAMEFVEFFEFIFFRNGIYDMNSLFIQEAMQIGYDTPALLGGLPSWCVLMRRREVPKPYVPTLPAEEPFVVASRVLARDGFTNPPQPRFLKRLVEEEWGEKWGDGPKSGLMLTSSISHDEVNGLVPEHKTLSAGNRSALDPGCMALVIEDHSAGLKKEAPAQQGDKPASAGPACLSNMGQGISIANAVSDAARRIRSRISGQVAPLDQGEDDTLQYWEVVD